DLFFHALLAIGVLGLAASFGQCLCALFITGFAIRRTSAFQVEVLSHLFPARRWIPGDNAMGLHWTGIANSDQVVCTLRKLEVADGRVREDFSAAFGFINGEAHAAVHAIVSAEEDVVIFYTLKISAPLGRVHVFFREIPGLPAFRHKAYMTDNRQF